VSYTVSFRPAAGRDLKALQEVDQKRIGAKIDALAKNPRPPGSKMLQGEERYMCLRVGTFRVIYDVRDEELLVLVIRIAHRREVYRK